MVFHADGVRGDFPLAGARAARAVYTLERMATGSVPQRLASVWMHGTLYTEVIFTYLRPSQRE